MVSYTGYGAWFTLRLLGEGHDVDYYLLDKKYSKVLKGMAPVPLSSKPNFAEYDLVLFDLTGKPKLAEESIALTPTIGDGNLQSQLEDDRLFGIQVMEQVGINVPDYEVFSSIDEAKAYVKETKKRYVFKPFGGQDQGTSATYVSESADDLLDYIDKLGEITKGSEFLLQEVVEGVEVSTEAWFNGEEFFFHNCTLEEKKFLNDGLGPNTGCAGNIVWAHNGFTPRIFTEGLGKMKDFLKEYEFRGMIDLNTIVSPTHVYGLEWTPRFGYDASATICALIESDLGKFFFDIASGGNPNETFKTNGRFAASIRLSIPPYPLEEDGFAQEGVHVNGVELEKIDREFYLYDALFDGEHITTAGINGFVVAPIAVGSTIEEAFELVCKKIKKLKIPDVQYRTDLCCKIKERYDKLQSQGWI